MQYLTTALKPLPWRITLNPTQLDCTQKSPKDELNNHFLVCVSRRLVFTTGLGFDKTDANVKRRRAPNFNIFTCRPFPGDLNMSTILLNIKTAAFYNNYCHSVFIFIFVLAIPSCVGTRRLCPNGCILTILVLTIFPIIL